jgi:hypothetical protein
MPACFAASPCQRTPRAVTPSPALHASIHYALTRPRSQPWARPTVHRRQISSEPNGARVCNGCESGPLANKNARCIRASSDAINWSAGRAAQPAEPRGHFGISHWAGHAFGPAMLSQQLLNTAPPGHWLRPGIQAKRFSCRIMARSERPFRSANGLLDGTRRRTQCRMQRWPQENTR